MVVLAVFTPRVYDSLLLSNSPLSEKAAHVGDPLLEYPAWAAPVLSRGRLYLRNEDTLLCLDVSKAIEPMDPAAP